MAVAMAKQTVIQAIKDYGRQLFGFIRSRVGSDEDAEDILQDVWYQFSNLSEVDAIESVSGWLYRVARNRITDSYRKRKSESLDARLAESEDADMSFKELLLADSPNPEEENFRQLFWDALFRALDELPENQREVFILNELEEMTLQEIADLKKEKLKTIISRKRYAVQHLRQRLENLYQDIINY